MIPYGRQNISQNDIDAVIETLRSDFITQGPAIDGFESALCELTSAKFATAMSSATAALHAIYSVLGVSRGDLVWTVPNSFVATANAAIYCGADVDFVDIDDRTYNMCVDTLEKKQEQEKIGRLPKLVVPVHFAGQSCDMEAISKLAKKYGFYVVEDASHAVGATYKGEKVGSCKYSDATVFSFHPVKIITTAEGGSVLTNSEEIKNRLDIFRSHGITREIDLLEGDSHGQWYYEQISLGFNYRITDIQAALGQSQLKRIDQFIDARHKKFQIYFNILSDSNLVLPYQANFQRSALHLYPVQLPENMAQFRKQVFNYMRENEIGVNVHYIPIHTQPYYMKRGFKWGDFPVSENYYSREISLPMFPDLTEEQISYVCSKLCEGIEKYA